MGLPTAVRAFDDISEVYDETRSPADPAALDAVVAHLRGAGIARLLEVGVGTGRIAGPLGERGLSVVGLDAARRMLEKARAKGVARLVQGSAHRLPFADGAFDAALFVHVLHVVDRPESVIREAARVSSAGVYALMNPARRDPGRERPEENPLRLLREDLAAHGAVVPDRVRGPGQREADLIAAHPPDATVTILDEERTEPVAKRLDLVARRASRHFRDVPPELLDPAIARVRATLGGRTKTFRHVELLVHWSGAGAAQKTADPPPVTSRTGGP
ncbi:MAG TPA: class I SAM-dependent methyltransferase [Thermoplasmata archaeon]|nr:class I SAM-dependent methyltransferase [Thermoplasmata archaeon]